MWLLLYYQLSIALPMRKQSHREVNTWLRTAQQFPDARNPRTRRISAYILVFCAHVQCLDLNTTVP